MMEGYNPLKHFYYPAHAWECQEIYRTPEWMRKLHLLDRRGCSKFVHSINMSDDEQADIAISATCRHQVVPTLPGMMQLGLEAGIAELLLAGE